MKSVVLAPKAMRDIESVVGNESPIGANFVPRRSAKGVEALSATPFLGTPARDTAAAGIRRIYLKGSKNFVYYSVSGDTVEVLRVWHSSRGGPPPHL